MVEAREEKGVNILWFVWTSDDSTGEDELLLVAQSGWEVEQDPHVEPGVTVFLLAAGHLRAVTMA